MTMRGESRIKKYNLRNPNRSAEEKSSLYEAKQRDCDVKKRQAANNPNTYPIHHF